MDELRTKIAGALLFLLLMTGAGSQAEGQARAGVTAVPQLDLNRFLTAWNVQAWMPNKSEKRCVSDVDILYAFGDKTDSFQFGTFCRLRNDSVEQWGARGKTDKRGGGKLKLRRLVLLSTPHWVLALGPEYEWALVGTPNHKRLWVLSKAATMEPSALAEIERQAAGQGFDLGKLVMTVRKSQAQ